MKATGIPRTLNCLLEVANRKYLEFFYIQISSKPCRQCEPLLEAVEVGEPVHWVLYTQLGPGLPYSHIQICTFLSPRLQGKSTFFAAEFRNCRLALKAEHAASRITNVTGSATSSHRTHESSERHVHIQCSLTKWFNSKKPGLKKCSV